MTLSTEDRHDALLALAAIRPDRYKRGDISWADPVIDDIADMMTATEARQVAAIDIVKNLERRATKNSNRLLRTIGSSGQLPSDWLDMARWPITVGEFRVCFEDLTPFDLRQFASEEEHRANKDHTARLDAVKGARELADLVELSHQATVGVYAEAVMS